MKPELLNEIKKDNSIIKIDWKALLTFLNIEEKIIIHIIWVHQGWNYFNINTRERFILKIIKKKDFQMQCNPIDLQEKVKILTNSEQAKFSSLYQLELNKSNKDVIFKLIEYPELGQSLITENEKSGFIIKY